MRRRENLKALAHPLTTAGKIAKVGVEGSNPFARSRFQRLIRSLKRISREPSFGVSGLDTTQPPPRAVILERCSSLPSV
jgi:hypothetical protein